MDRDLSHWAEWSDDELIDQAAGASQSRELLEDAVVREAIALNVIAPFRQALEIERNTIRLLTDKTAKQFGLCQ